MLAAEALGLRQDLVELFRDFDERPLRDHIDMYLRTHPPHAPAAWSKWNLRKSS